MFKAAEGPGSGSPAGAGSSGLCQGAASRGLRAPAPLARLHSAHPLGGHQVQGGCRPLVPVSVRRSAGFSGRALHPGGAGAGDRDPRRVPAPREPQPCRAGPRRSLVSPGGVHPGGSRTGEDTAAVHADLGLPLQKGSRQVDILGSSRRRRREMAARAPLAWSHTAICWPPRGTAASPPR